MKTISEICSLLGITRRTVQWYEKKNLITASGKNKFGYLLYDDQQIRRIKLIRFYRDMEISIDEIKDLLDAPKSKVEEVLCRQVVILKAKQDKYEEIIKRAKKFIEDFEEI